MPDEKCLFVATLLSACYRCRRVRLWLTRSRDLNGDEDRRVSEDVLLIQHGTVHDESPIRSHLLPVAPWMRPKT
jgi:hypothetical protein